jgi:3-dehydroquinate dehydratase II
MTTKHLLVINGPNLNLLGTREPTIYGSATLKNVEDAVLEHAARHHIQASVFQSNHEGAIVDRIHEAQRDGVDAIVINPGAFTHTSVAIRDAFAGTAIPFVELHISNVHKREAFRHHSYLSDKAEAVICGLGVFGYLSAMDFWLWNFKLLKDISL